MGCKGVVWQWMRMSELEKKKRIFREFRFIFIIWYHKYYKYMNDYLAEKKLSEAFFNLLRRNQMIFFVDLLEVNIC